MAITEIHAITKTPERALNYILADKIVQLYDETKINTEYPHEISDKNNNKFIRFYTLNNYQNSNTKDPFIVYKELQNKWQGKRYKSGVKTKPEDEPVMWHLFQSFEGYECDVHIANEIGRKLAEEVFKDFTVTISTHTNTENIHNHLMISAWDNHGKKWNDCLATKRKIRRVSDRLCKEYGLSVLEHTKDMKVVKYKDSNGNVKYYEPTDRKNDLIDKRNKGELANDDVNSYQNTLSYEKREQENKSNHVIIKNDIDMLLPSCNSYDELLTRLRDMGYTIRDKKKNGDWLKHISFQAPMQEKASREDKIGDGDFYLRNNLTNYFANREKQVGEDSVLVPDRELDTHYEYGKTDLDGMKDNYRIAINDNNDLVQIQRTENEKIVLTDIRIKDKEVKTLINTDELNNIIKGMNKGKNTDRSVHLKAELLVSQIKDSFRCLETIENYNIYSYQQIIDLYKESKDKYDTASKHIIESGTAIAKLKELLLLPEKLKSLAIKIETNKYDDSYMLANYNEDMKLKDSYEKTITGFHLDIPNNYSDLKNKVDGYEQKQIANNEYMKGISDQMSVLENCIRTFDRIDSDKGIRNENMMKRFEQLVGGQLPGGRGTNNTIKERREER